MVVDSGGGGTLVVTTTEMNNFTETKADDGFLDFPVTVPIIFSSITLALILKRKKMNSQ